MLVIATLVIGVGVILSSIPQDPASIYKQAKEELTGEEPEKFPATLERLRKYPEFASHVTFLEGKLAMGQRRQPRALELFEAASENKELLPEILPEIGVCRTQIGDYKGAIEVYEQAIELTPDDASRSRIQLSRLYFMVGAKELANQVVKQVIEDEPRNPDARMLLATTSQDFKRHQEALDHLLVVLDTPGDFASANPRLLEQYVDCLLAVEDNERLTEFEEKYIGAITDDALKARIALATGNVRQARSALAESVQGGMASPAMRLAYANLELADGGNPAKASPIIEQNISSLPRDINGWKAAKKLYEITKNEDRAARAQQNIEQLDALSDELLEAYRIVASDIDNVDGRIDVMKALIRVGQFPEAQRWANLINNMDPGRNAMNIFEEEASRIRVLVPLTENEPAEGADTKETDAKETEAE